MSKNYVGQRFGMLVVLEEVSGHGHGKQFVCKCDCGNTKTISKSKVIRGATKSCGCLKNKHGMHQTRVYQTWADMKTRCKNPSNRRYKDYGGRGIKVCARWESFENFWEDMGTTYQDGLQLDRIDNNKGYFPENCRWVTPAQNARNRRTNVFVTILGEKKCVTDWAELFGVNSKTILARAEKYPAVEVQHGA